MGPSGAQEQEDEFLPVFEGVVSKPLAAFRSGDEAARDRAAETLIEIGDFALPFLRQAFETTGDEDLRERLGKLIARIRGGTVRDPAEWVYQDHVAREAQPGWAEYPPYERPLFEQHNKALAAAAERTLLDRHPRSLATARVHIEAKRYEEAIGVLLAVAREDPGKLRSVLDLAAGRWFHDERSVADRVSSLEELAEEVRTGLSGERAAWIAYGLAAWWRDGRGLRLEEVAERYAGTEAGRRAEMEAIRSSNRPTAERVEGLLDFADRHPGTPAAAAALESVAFHLHTVNLIVRGESSLDRLRKLASVLARLGGAEFSDGARHATAYGYLSRFFLPSREELDSESASVMLEAYRVFLRHHFLVDGLHPETATGWVFFSKLGRLHGVLGAKGDELTAKLEAELDALMAAVPEKVAVRYFRALADIKHERFARAESRLSDLAKGERLLGRRALATLATLRYSTGDFGKARKAFEAYVKAHPRSAYAWVAALRAGHSDARAGRWAQAIRKYADARTAYPASRLFKVLAAVGAARVHEQQDDYEAAAKEYESALAAWSPDLPEEVHSRLTGLPGPPGPAFDPDAPIGREWVEERIRALSRPGVDRRDIARLEKGRRLAAAGKDEVAIEALKELLPAERGSPLAGEARATIARIFFRRGLGHADRQGGPVDLAKARVALREAATWGDPFFELMSGMALACLSLRDEGGRATAAGKLAEILDHWAALRPPAEATDDLARDVAGVRRAAFRPYTPEYARRRYPPQEKYPHAYAIVDPETEVVLADGSKKVVAARPTFPSVPRVLFFTKEERSEIEAILTRLGSTYGRDRKAGDTEEILDLFRRYFPVGPGHWGGWHLRTYPILWEVRFTDAARTAAEMKFRVKNQGGAVSVRKTDGDWKLQNVTYRWIE